MRIVQIIPNSNLLTQNHARTITVFTEMPIKGREYQDCKAVTLILSSTGMNSFHALSQAFNETMNKSFKSPASGFSQNGTLLPHSTDEAKWCPCSLSV